MFCGKRRKRSDGKIEWREMNREPRGSRVRLYSTILFTQDPSGRKTSQLIC